MTFVDDGIAEATFGAGRASTEARLILLIVDDGAFARLAYWGRRTNRIESFASVTISSREKSECTKRHDIGTAKLSSQQQQQQRRRRRRRRTILESQQRRPAEGRPWKTYSTSSRKKDDTEDNAQREQAQTLLFLERQMDRYRWRSCFPTCPSFARTRPRRCQAKAFAADGVQRTKLKGILSGSMLCLFSTSSIASTTIEVYKFEILSSPAAHERIPRVDPFIQGNIII